MSARSPLSRPGRLLRTLRTPRRPQSLTVLGLLAAVAALLLWTSRRMVNYGENLALNLGTDIVGVVVTVFVIGPLISRAQEGRVREHTRLDYEWFSSQVYGATSNVKVLDTFSSVFGPQFSERLFRGIKAATAHGARVQILLLDPDSLAVILRGRELGSGAPTSAATSCATCAPWTGSRSGSTRNPAPSSKCACVPPPRA